MGDDKIIGPWVKEPPGVDRKCPICGADIKLICRCPMADSVCENDHQFHICTEHMVFVRGPGSHDSNPFGCSCGREE